MPSEAATLVGQVVAVCIGVAPEKITIRANSREVDCYCATPLRDQLARLPLGSIVEVAGEAAVDSQGQIQRLNRLDSIASLSPGPLRIARFESGGMVFSLQEPLVVEVELCDGLWVHHNSSLNLWGSGDSREAALVDLRDNFAFLWREFAEELDEKLDARALEIKRALLNLVATTSVG